MSCVYSGKTDRATGKIVTSSWRSIRDFDLSVLDRVVLEFDG